MKSNYQRFEDAYKRLQKEIQNKSSKTIIKRSTSLKKKDEEIKIKPKPPEDNIKSRSKRQKSVTINDKSLNKEVIEPINPRNFIHMIRLNTAGELSARPKEINPIFEIKTFNYNSNKKTENIKNKVKIISKNLNNNYIDLNNNEIINDRLPLEFFDCYNFQSESEKNLIQFGIPTKGKSKILISENKFEWKNCIIKSYNSNYNTYNIIFDLNKNQEKEISRFALNFYDEDLNKFEIRKKIAEEMRSVYEKWIRTNLFLDNFELNEELLYFVSDKFKKILNNETKNIII